MTENSYVLLGNSHQSYLASPIIEPLVVRVRWYPKCYHSFRRILDQIASRIFLNISMCLRSYYFCLYPNNEIWLGQFPQELDTDGTLPGGGNSLISSNIRKIVAYLLWTQGDSWQIYYGLFADSIILPLDHMQFPMNDH